MEKYRSSSYNKYVPPIFKKLLPLALLITTVCSLVITITIIRPFLPFTGYLLGQETPTSFIILLQNDTELRANGGFAGSYAKVSLSTKDTRPAINISFQDIYVPNGQLSGHVDPPAPIQEAFQHGTWELANADWEPDFPSAASAIRWFLEKGGETNPDILVTLSLTTIKKVLNIVGPFKVKEFQAEITPQNIYSFLQSQAETDFFPGSTQKKDALTAVGTALWKKTTHLNPVQYLKIFSVIADDLNHANMLLHSSNPSFQKFLEAKGWAGKIIPGPHDNYLLVEANLGANKANCCIDRLTDHTIFTENNTYRHRVHLSLTNTSSGHNPSPPFDFSGNYISFLRFYIPENAWGIEVSLNESTPSSQAFVPSKNPPLLSKKFGLTEIGFFHTTA